MRKERKDDERMFADFLMFASKMSASTNQLH